MDIIEKSPEMAERQINPNGHMALRHHVAMSALSHLNTLNRPCDDVVNNRLF